MPRQINLPTVNSAVSIPQDSWLGTVKSRAKTTILGAIKSNAKTATPIVDARSPAPINNPGSGLFAKSTGLKSAPVQNHPEPKISKNNTKQGTFKRFELPSKVMKLVHTLGLFSRRDTNLSNDKTGRADAQRASSLHESGIATPHPLATEAGLKVLEQGGNAYDAAVTVAAVLAVVEPFGSGLGGGGSWLFHDERQNKSVFVDGREKAPFAATEEMFQKADGTVDRELATNHPVAAAIPGTPAAMIHVQKKYGSMSLERLLRPAIEHAEKGFPISSNYINVLESNYASLIPLKVLQKWPSSAAFLDNGQLPEPGWVLKQPELAQTLKQIAAKGRKGFYEGEVAKTMVKQVQSNGGLWTLKDLAQYDVAEREPVIFKYRDYTVTSSPLPSSGGLVMAGIFGQLEKHNYQDASEADRAHLFIEAMRNAYYQRAQFMGDSEFTHDDGFWLFQQSEIDRMASNISLHKARPSSEMPLLTSGTSGTQTTHFSVIDAKGNRAAVTLSLNAFFGSGFTAKGTGVLLNNEMDDFSAKPGVPNAFGLVGSEANKIEPGKRPLSSMTPGFLEGPNGAYVLGTPGGSRIISMVSKGILDAIDGNNAEEVVAKGRIHHQYLPDIVEYEDGAISERVKTELERRGHTLQQTAKLYGNLQVVHWNKAAQSMSGASDPRREGVASITKSASNWISGNL